MSNENNKKKNIVQIKTFLKKSENHPETLTPEIMDELRNDERQGVRQLLKSFENKQAKQAKKKASFEKRLLLEKEAWQNGNNLVAGIDEVGRGPLAGPVVAAAVILPHDFALYEVNDSKQLSIKKRAQLAPLIKEQALSIGIGVADNQKIDEINIYEAARFAMEQAVLQLDPQPDQLLIDAMVLHTKIPQRKLIKGDARSASIAAASIVAKVTRDQLMTEYAQLYPGYGFEKNAGYGTKQHLAGLKKYGITPIHRQTFEPIKSKLIK
ncbi:ribonuclease HII [Ligilactobacillus acidipiscis DSM 15836]|uniref:Ribonuclease HII n=1 Tax=Ligilactobacillus acidipiscis DSM 15836 TaxID=1423716 RepID=A0ABR5PLG0_9LACO|nr:ribonuclease HII [Ligilactobacillus acidipiscis]KRM29860.1 ribonuclease HII [Ligilactobacillus acidipiscis DSM 15836]GAW63508.1 ribonuclease HII [Ligilactobacillus acidipiscis]GEN20767.1 ribonuclease HII [Ligilactobacillus acidipiscis]